MYFAISVKDENVIITQFKKNDLLTAINNGEIRLDRIINEIPSCEPRYWEGCMVLIEGRIVTPGSIKLTIKHEPEKD
jgi:hypothetical protein